MDRIFQAEEILSSKDLSLEEIDTFQELKGGQRDRDLDRVDGNDECRQRLCQAMIP